MATPEEAARQTRRRWRTTLAPRSSSLCCPRESSSRRGSLKTDSQEKLRTGSRAWTDATSRRGGSSRVRATAFNPAHGVQEDKGSSGSDPPLNRGWSSSVLFSSFFFLEESSPGRRRERRGNRAAGSSWVGPPWWSMSRHRTAILRGQSL